MRLTRPNRHRLDPVRWPRRRLRALLAAALVIAAAGVLYAGSHAPDPGPPQSDPDRCTAPTTAARRPGEVRLLTEIRDALRERNATPASPRVD